MTRLSSDNPHLPDIERLEAELNTERENFRLKTQKLKADLKEAQAKAQKHERQNSPIKAIGKELIELAQTKTWEKQVKSELTATNMYKDVMHKGWEVEFVVESYVPKYLTDNWVRWKCILRDPERKVRKITTCDGWYQWTDMDTALNLFYPDMVAWAHRMAKRG